MRTTIKAKVHLLATDKPNPNLFIHRGLGSDLQVLSTGQGIVHHKEMMECGVSKPQHLYFTTDEEIKEGDWRLYYNTGKICKTTKEDLLLIKYYEEECKKIVATTNPELWYNRNELTERGRFEKSLLEKSNSPYPRAEEAIHMAWFKATNVAKIDIPFIEAYIKAYNEGKPITEVLLEQERTAPDGMEFAAPPSMWGDFYDLKLKSNGSVTVHPVKERMYTREEFKKP